MQVSVVVAVVVVIATGTSCNLDGTKMEIKQNEVVCVFSIVYMFAPLLQFPGSR